jgi:c-di-GMP-binding flagellar brake protein YcgR
MREKRRHSRYSLDDMEVNGKMLFATDVKILDISVGGVSLKANRRLNIGCEYELKLQSRKRLLSVKGVVVRSSLSSTKEVAGREAVPVYTAGLSFTKISPEKVAELTDFIESHKKQEKVEPCVVRGPRAHVRFHISDPEKSVLEYPENYPVRKISLSGMMIESSYPFEIERRYPMELFLHDDTSIVIQGRIASCRERGGGQYAIGVEFIDLKGRDKEELVTFTDWCAAAEAESDEAPATATPEEKPVDLPRELLERIEYLHKWHRTLGYYKFLGVKEYATEQQIRNAYTTMAKEFHPDKYPDVSDELKGKLNEIFKYLSSAYSTLIDREKRKKYDETTKSILRK